ncbi:Lsr2 family DNA-binding protein [Curtobacterium flaccumfaciens]|uniref:Lsr2 family DNA-binding protein n=1 Tax=Curtobacterium flaccumfaciens TaxID=2035 RepID=UPI003B984690
MLVTGGSFSGGKLAKAQELGTRHVHPNIFDVLLQHLQPAEARLPQAARPSAPALIATVPADAAPASSAAVRAWVVAAGHDVGMRTRLPTHVIDAYGAAHR